MTERERLEAEAAAKEAEADRVFQAKGRAGLGEAAALQDEAQKLRAQAAALPAVPGSAAPTSSTPATRSSVTNLLSGSRTSASPAPTGGTVVSATGGGSPAPVRTTGAVGPAGPSGSPGPTGPAGPPGPTGPTGATPSAPPALPPTPPTPPAPAPTPTRTTCAPDRQMIWLGAVLLFLGMMGGCFIHSFSQFQARQQLRYGIPIIQNTGGQAATPQAPPTTTRRPSSPRRRPDPVVEDVQKGLDEYFEKRAQEALNP